MVCRLFRDERININDRERNEQPSVVRDEIGEKQIERSSRNLPFN